MQAENNFQALKIFEDESTNKICDDLSAFIFDKTGEELLIVGSVAKLFSEQLDSNYSPKDIDMVVSKAVFRRLWGLDKNTFENIKMIEKRPERIILYTNKLALEIWEFATENINREKKYYKEKIPYLEYAN